MKDVVTVIIDLIYLTFDHAFIEHEVALYLKKGIRFDGTKADLHAFRRAGRAGHQKLPVWDDKTKMILRRDAFYDACLQVHQRSENERIKKVHERLARLAGDQDAIYWEGKILAQQEETECTGY